jgi:hypothetical protein
MVEDLVPWGEVDDGVDTVVRACVGVQLVGP